MDTWEPRIIFMPFINRLLNKLCIHSSWLSMRNVWQSRFHVRLTSLSKSWNSATSTNYLLLYILSPLLHHPTFPPWLSMEIGTLAIWIVLPPGLQRFSFEILQTSVPSFNVNQNEFRITEKSGWYGILVIPSSYATPPPTTSIRFEPYAIIKW